MRQCKIKRKTNETDIFCYINLDGTGNSKIDSGIGFFDHMLQLLTFHGCFDLEIKAKGDLHVDDHHTVEDTGIVIGQTIKDILSRQKNISRYGYALVPMDEVLCRAVIDISGRSFCKIGYSFKRESINNFATENVAEFFTALTREANITLHLNIIEPGNTHHEIEAMFKAFGVALKESVKVTENRTSTSTKSLGRA